MFFLLTDDLFSPIIKYYSRYCEHTHTPTHTPEMTDKKYDFESFHELIIETSCTNYLLEILHCQL